MPEIGRRALWPFLLLITACSGPDERVGDPDGSLGSAGLQPQATEDSATGPQVVVPGSGTVAPGSGTVAPNDTGAWMLERPPAGSAPNPHPWTDGRSSGGTRASGAATLLTVRTARHEGYDRVVFEFDSHVPEWRAEYVDSPGHECGSGAAVRVAGDGWLGVRFEMANAHTEDGRATAAPRRMTDPAGAHLRELRRTCDFEARVEYVIGVDEPNEYRAFELSGPSRLVVDLRGD